MAQQSHWHAGNERLASQAHSRGPLRTRYQLRPKRANTPSLRGSCGGGSGGGGAEALYVQAAATRSRAAL